MLAVVVPPAIELAEPKPLLVAGAIDIVHPDVSSPSRKSFGRQDSASSESNLAADDLGRVYRELIRTNTAPLAIMVELDAALVA